MFRSFLLSALLCAIAGCKDECNAADFPARCEENVLVTCPTPGVDQLVPVRISRRDCGASFCVSLDAGALCAMSQDPSELCGGQVRGACDGAEAFVYCSQGFVTYRNPCRACVATDAGAECQGGPSSRCVDTADCAQGLTCRDAGVSSYCFG